MTWLSQRARAVLDTPPTPAYIGAHYDREPDAWDSEHAPNGYVGLCIAENRLVFDLLEPRLAECRTVVAEELAYDSMIGSLGFRTVLADFMGRTIVGRSIDPDHLAVLNGVGSVLELLFYVLCDPGDGVLIPTPSYTGFWSDLETRDQVTIVPVHTTSADDFALTTAQLDEAAATAERPIKALLFTNPNNPLGRVHPPEQVLEIIGWARDRGIHLVLDEIYALSTFGDTPFTSGGHLVEELHDGLHLVWGFSKDFAMSGLRSGVLYTQNRDVLAAVEGLAYWASTSGDTQSLLRQLLSDPEWVDSYILENRRRLLASYSEVTAVLDDYGVSYVPAEAGLFFMVDLRRLLHAPTWDAEDVLWRRLLDETNINITPGSECHNGEPGLFRFVFACVDPASAVEGARRLGEFAMACSA